MPASKAQQKATNKYIAKAYDRINLTVPKGKRETINAHAEARGKSVNGFINEAIDEKVERDSIESGPDTRPTATQEAAGSGLVSLPSDTLKTAQEAAEAEGEAVPVFIARAIETQAERDTLSRKLTAQGPGH